MYLFKADLSKCRYEIVLCQILLFKNISGEVVKKCYEHNILKIIIYICENFYYCRYILCCEHNSLVLI